MFFHHGNLVRESGVARINYVDQQVRFIEFFEGGLECLEKFIGQIPDKSNGVGYYYLYILWEPKSTACLKECILSKRSHRPDSSM